MIALILTGVLHKLAPLSQEEVEIRNRLDRYTIHLPKGCRLKRALNVQRCEFFIFPIPVRGHYLGFCAGPEGEWSKFSVIFSLLVYGQQRGISAAIALVTIVIYSKPVWVYLCCLPWRSIDGTETYSKSLGKVWIRG